MSLSSWDARPRSANGERDMLKGLYQQQFCIVDMLPCLAASGLLLKGLQSSAA